MSRRSHERATASWGDVIERRENVSTGSLQPPIQDQIREPMPVNRHRLLWTALTIGVLVGAVVWWAADPPPSPSIRPLVPVGRVLVRSTSESRSPARVALGHPTDSLALNPDGRKIFVTSATFPAAGRLSIVSIENQTVRTIALPTDGGPLAVSPDRKLYIGSRVEGLMVFDITREQLQTG